MSFEGVRAIEQGAAVRDGRFSSPMRKVIKPQRGVGNEVYCVIA